MGKGEGTSVDWQYVCVCVCVRAHTSACANLCPTLFGPWTVAHQASLSMGFPRQGYWSGLPCPAPGDFLTRDRICISCVSCIGRQILYHCTTREALGLAIIQVK